MTRERLLSLSPDELLLLSDKIGIDAAPEMGREHLIDNIMEALEEDRIEREQINNFVMRVKEKKYDISRDEEIDFSGEEEYSIPDKYNETKISLLLRDPLWAFAYWDIKDTDLIKLKSVKLLLRVYKKVKLVEKDDFFDIPVAVADKSWYINLPDSDCEYYVELYSSSSNCEKLLGKSNIISSPKTQMDFQNLGNNKEKILLLSGLTEIDNVSSSTGIPQRIISFLDNQYLQIRG